VSGKRVEITIKLGYVILMLASLTQTAKCQSVKKSRDACTNGKCLCFYLYPRFTDVGNPPLARLGSLQADPVFRTVKTNLRGALVNDKDSDSWDQIVAVPEVLEVDDLMGGAGKSGVKRGVSLKYINHS
jgi:hypothetical protein